MISPLVCLFASKCLRLSLNSRTARGVKSGVNRAMLEFLLRNFDGDNLLNVHVLAQGLHGLEKTLSLLVGDETNVMIKLKHSDCICWRHGLVIGTGIIII